VPGGGLIGVIALPILLLAQLTALTRTRRTH
jgi:hypothetical protein